MKPKLTVATASLTVALMACTPTDEAVDRRAINSPTAADNLVRVRTEHLPFGGTLYILKDRLSSRCFTYSPRGDFRQVTDDVCDA